jgi:hypothetical protein
MKFENFLADMGECPLGLTIERLNNDLGYTPENCAWRSQIDQQRNSSNTKLTLKKAIEIASRALTGEPHERIAKDFGVKKSIVGWILHGEAWPEAIVQARADVRRAPYFEPLKYTCQVCGERVRRTKCGTSPFYVVSCKCIWIFRYSFGANPRPDTWGKLVNSWWQVYPFPELRGLNGLISEKRNAPSLKTI